MNRVRRIPGRTGGILAWVVIVAVAAGVYWLWRGPSASVTIRPADGPPPNMIQMQDVRIEIFDEQFHQTAELRGKTATTFKDNPDLILEPADCVLLRERGQNVHITSARARKVVQRGQQDRLEFTGEANVETQGRKLLSEKLIYTPTSRLLESGAPVTIKTTGSVILGEHLRSNTDLKTGTLEGDVQITSLGEGGRNLDAPVLVRGKRSEFDLERGLYDVIGSAWAKKADCEVKADKMAFNRRRNALTADGNAIASRPDLTVKAGHLEYWVDRDAATATDNPKAVQMTPRTTSEDETRSDLAARTLEMDFKRQILEGKDDVVLVRHVKYEGDWEKDYEIHSKFVSSLYGKGRSTFRDDVSIEASKVGAVSDRAIFYQNNSKLYLIGRAKAWDYDEERHKQNEVEGEKILHDLTTGKSQVLGKVIGALQEGQTAPKPENRLRRPRGRVDVKFNEGDEQ